MDRKTVYLIHGFNVRDGGAKTTDLLGPLYRKAGFRVKELDYGFTGLLRTKMCNRPVAKVLATTLIPGSLIVGHSNGCALIWRMARAGAKFDRAVLINPALDRRKTIDGAASVHVWHSPSDLATHMARLIPFSKWGNQGQVGYVGEDERYRNFNEDHIVNKRVGHSGVFREPELLQTIFNFSTVGIPPQNDEAAP